MLRMTFKTTVVCLNTFHSFSREDSFEMRDVLGEEDVKSEVIRLKTTLDLLSHDVYEDVRAQQQ